MAYHNLSPWTFIRTPNPRPLTPQQYLGRLRRAQSRLDAAMVTTTDLSAFDLSHRTPPADPRGRTFRWGDDETLRRAALGALAVLPVETLLQVLTQLDLGTLARLQAASRGLRLAVGSIPALRAVLDLAPSAVRAVAATRTGHLVRCDALFAALCDGGCVVCSEPGTYLYLLACHRVCYRCLTTNDRYRPLRPMQAVAQLGLRRQDVLAMPTMSVPKFHTDRHHLRHPRPRHMRNTTGWRLVDRGFALRRSLAVHRSKAEIQRVEERKLRELRRWPSSRATQRLALHNPPGVESSLSAAIPFPWFDVGTGQAVARAVVCEACRGYRADRRTWYYTEAGFAEHERMYGKVIEGAHALRV